MANFWEGYAYFTGRIIWKEVISMDKSEVCQLIAMYEKDGLLDKVLTRGGIFSSCQEYQDYRQDLQIMLLELIQNAPSQVDFIAEYHGSRLFGKLLWSLKDSRRDQRRRQKLVEVIDEPAEELLYEVPDESLRADELVTTADFWESFQQSLSTKEAEKMQRLLLDGATPCLNRNVRHKYRQALRKKFKLFCQKQATLH